MRFVFSFVLVFVVAFGYSQKTTVQLKEDKKISASDRVIDTTKLKKNQSSGNVWKNPNKITDYKIYGIYNDTTYVDTSLTIYKDYKFNFLRKDDFELMPFSNTGQTYTSLAKDTQVSLFPQMGQRAKYFSFYEADDVKYYHVPTPVTELAFKTTMQQGQLLDASLALNTSKQLSLFIAYRGLRSLGKYRNIRVSTGNFRISSNYHSKNGRYDLKIHFAGQDIANQENVGILYNDYFTSGEEEFNDRDRLEVIVDDAENILVAKRYFMRNEYNIIQQKDSVGYNVLSVGHQYNYETKRYYFYQDAAAEYFGDSYLSNRLNELRKLRTMNNEVFATWSNSLLGDIGFKVINYNYDYLYTSVTNVNGITIPPALSGNETAVGASYGKTLGGFNLKGGVTTTLVGDLGGTTINAQASYKFNENNNIQAAVTLNSRMPNFNFLMYQSDYVNYNWYNINNLEKQQTRTLNAQVNLKKIANIDFAYSIIDKYTYFKETDLSDSLVSVVEPNQYNGTINYLKLKLQREFRVGKFGLENTIMYQKVMQDDPIYNVPELVTRNTLYFATPMFKRALDMQIGVTFKYFTKYYADKYNPLLSEFTVQDTQEIGEFPLFDVFLDFKIRQTRFYFKAEHLNSAWTGYNYYSAPNNPYRDFTFRFGLVWNFFS